MEDKSLYNILIPFAGFNQGDKCGFPKQPPLDAAFGFLVPEQKDVPHFLVQFSLDKTAPSSFALTGLNVITPVNSTLPPAPKRPAVVSQNLPPKLRADVHASFASIGFTPGTALGNGDCFPLSSMAGFEITPSEAANPSASTTEIIRLARVEAIDTLCGHGKIGGIEAKTVRREESIKVTAVVLLPNK